MREQLGFGTKYVSDLTAAEKAASMEAWKAASMYGRRWTVEIVFSAVKRLFGSDVRALGWKNIVREVGLKAGGPLQQAGRHGLGGDRMGDLGGGGRSGAPAPSGVVMR